MSTASTWRTRASLGAAAVLVLAGLVWFGPAPAANAAISQEAFEHCLLDKANEERADVGAPPLEMAYDKVDHVRDWSEWMRFNDFVHMPGSVREPILPDDWTRWGENIAHHRWQEMPDCNPIHQLWMNSDGHRANILNPDFRFGAFGAYVDGSGWWATQLFFDATGYDPLCDGTFCDDDDSVFEASIEKIAGVGITQGCNPPVNTNYCPDRRVTRGAMAAFLARALNLPAANGTDFVDDNDSVFESAIEKIASAGITQGCNPPVNDRYCPDRYVTRGEMAAFLARALNVPADNGTDFVDDDNSVFEASIEKIAGAGITQGCNPPSNTRFCPGDYVTRGQMAAFLARALGL